MLGDKQRILIIGNGGAGKSTFSKILGSKLNLKVYHLDKLFWKPNWEKRDNEEWRLMIEELSRKDKWIIEGNYTRTIEARALRSDLIFFFDYAPALCVYRIFKRSVQSKFLNKRRDDIADGCRERFPDWEFIRFVWRFNKASRPRIYSILEEINYDKNNLIIFNNRRKFNQYVNDL